MSEKKVYEIAKKLSDKKNLEKDMEEAAELVARHFQRKYTERLYSALNKCQENSANNPSKELRLIQAVRPFLNQEHHEKIDGMEQMLTILSTFENIRKEAGQAEEPKPLSNEPGDPAIHEDGIYEVDEACMMKKRKPFVPDVAGLMLVMGLIGKGAK